MARIKAAPVVVHSARARIAGGLHHHPDVDQPVSASWPILRPDHREQHLEALDGLERMRLSGRHENHFAAL
jgi:hypothetical protein